MPRVMTLSIFPVGHGWSVQSDERPIELSFIDLGTALDVCIALGESRPLRVVVRDRAEAASRRAAA